jgi:hypothetical protein
VVLVPVADDQRLWRVENRERNEQLRLAARLEPQVERAPVLDQLLHHLPLLVHLDRVDSAVGAAVLVLFERLLEAASQLANAALEDVREANQHRAAQTPPPKLPHQVEQIDSGALGSPRVDLHAARVTDGEVRLAPVRDPVELRTIPHGPTPHGYPPQRAGTARRSPLPCTLRVEVV